MGCTGLVIAGLLALAVPASIAPASLPGALVVIVLLAAAGAAAVVVRARQRPVVEGGRTVRNRLLVVGCLALGYAAVAVAIHAAA